MGPDGGGGGGGAVESCRVLPELAMVGPDAHKSSVLIPIWHPREMPWYLQSQSTSQQ